MAESPLNATRADLRPLCSPADLLSTGCAPPVCSCLHSQMSPVFLTLVKKVPSTHHPFSEVDHIGPTGLLSWTQNLLITSSSSPSCLL